MKKTLIILTVLALLGGGGLWYWLSARGAAASTTPTLPTAQVERGPLRIVVASTGKIVSNQDVDIKCKASGEVIFLPYDVSDRVKKGDVLLKLDIEDQEQVVAKAQAALDASVAQLEQAKQDLVVSKQALVTARMRADANLLMAQAQLKDAHTKANRERELLAKRLASQEDFDTADTTAAVADANLKTAEAQIEDLKTQELGLALKEQIINMQQANVKQNEVNLKFEQQQLDYATVVSPLDGVVAALITGKDVNGNNILTRIGTIVQSGTSTVSGGTTVMTLSDLSHIFVYANVDEADMRNIEDPQDSPGGDTQKVRITADAFKGVEFEGRVVRVASKGVNSSNVVTFEVRIEVTSSNKYLLRPEMTANVEVIKSDQSDVLLVPVAAVTRKVRTPGAHGPETTSTSTPATLAAVTTQEGNNHHGYQERRKATVTVLKPDGAQETRDVTLGLDDGTHYEVLAGLTDGETLLVNKTNLDSRWRPPTPPGGMMMGGGPRR